MKKMQESGGGDRRSGERSDCLCPGGAVEGDRMKVEVTESDKGVLSLFILAAKKTIIMN